MEQIPKRRNDAGAATQLSAEKKAGRDEDGKTEKYAVTAEPENNADGTGGADSEWKGVQIMTEISIPVKKQVETSEIQYGACKYCGQVHQFETVGMCSQDQLDEWASEKCDCSEAKEAEKMRKREQIARMNIEDMFGRYDTATILQAAVHPVATCAVDSVTINIGNGEKATIKLTGKGKIQVKKTTTLEDTKEH